MLTLSETAATLLAESRSRKGIPDDAVLRVAGAAGEGEQGVTLGFVDEPEAGDRTGSAHGMKLCVAPDVAEALDGAQIDTQISGGSTQLVIVPAG